MAIAINGSSNTITGLAVGGLPDGVVDTDMLAANAVTVAKATGSVKGIQMVDAYRLSSSFSFSAAVVHLDSNWERVDSDYPAFIGTGMTESSGIFSFPTTGIYLIQFRYHVIYKIHHHLFLELLHNKESMGFYLLFHIP